MIGIVIWVREERWNCPLGIVLHVIKDAYLKDDKHWVFGFKHGCELSIEAHDHLYVKKIGWLYLGSLICGFFYVLCFSYCEASCLWDNTIAEQCYRNNESDLVRNNFMHAL